ncbi:replicative DNA helicase [Aerococcus urinaeequi]|uniref:Replicative DNA helicase n=3 Tax=Bacillati TaxID=1783272 RepID=A0A0U4HSL9_9LACT|nr:MULTISPECIES: replicative DNA helicase [Lactobacillales]ALZ88666.1 replicative DNA helicase [Aerococcus urinaeequi]AMB97560.1 replicative DNA helicase [Aerococcus urinaeequi]KAF3301686.1 replicative DNA helicase [Carnobacterium sp. PL12RED10]KAF3302320.1 replicative DNA helicase [Carnobacterium sp. PL26RED25]KAF3305904.1 replicative DNA helicase [Carnobacterium sp. PL24RED07]
MAENLDHTTPPQSIEAEQAVLGAILLDSDVFISVLEYVSADDFYSRANQLIFEAMEELNRDDEAIDALTVQQKLNNMHMLENVGGYEYIFQLANDTPTAANAEYYARIVEEKSLLRKLIQASNKIARESFEQEESVSVILDEAEKSILNVAENRNRNGFIHIRDVVFESMQNLDDLSKNGQDVTGIPTGYPDLDAMTAGLQPEELIILAARPAVGKTAFALNIAQNVATKQDGVVAVFSLEMGAGSLVNRMICAEGSINAGHLRTGQLTEDEWSDLIVASGALSEADIYIDDTPGIRVTEIRSKSRRLLKERGRLDLIVIDYLQLIEGSGKRNENRQQEVSDISRQLKKIAKELHVPVIALSQLSRGVEQRQDKRPVLSDIRESGSIEQDADIVAFLYRDDYYERGEGEEDDGGGEPRLEDNIVEVIIEKNRSGARGTVKLIFTKEFNKFSSVSFRTDDEMFA